LTLFAPPKGPKAAGNLKFSIHVFLGPKMLQITFEERLSSGYQKDVKNVQILTHTIYYV
jgi:hypothetical protein